jgi:hypothetical protein
LREVVVCRTDVERKDELLVFQILTQKLYHGAQQVHHCVHQIYVTTTT